MRKIESLLHYTWKYRVYDPSTLITSNGCPVLVIDPGIHNTDAGPDFFNAKVKIGEQIWAGNIEIHLSASDWFKHGHHLDKAYNSVILHVAENIDHNEICRENGEIIPQLVLRIPESVKENYDYLSNKELNVPCTGRIREIPPVYLADWLSALLAARIEHKTGILFQLLDDLNGDWQEVFYILLSRNFGFGINNDAFERLAKSLPLRYIFKHRDSPMQVEALFFGQAGLLTGVQTEDEYFLALQKEYAFLSKKFDLQALDAHIFRSLRIRPFNFPHVKLAQLSALVRNQEHLFSKLLETEEADELRQLFISRPEPYWLTHYHFQKVSPKSEKCLGRPALDILLINTGALFLFAYGKKKNETHFMKKAIRLLETIAGEKNSIVTLFSQAGITVRNAADSQALIHLRKEFCEKRKCVFCRIGHKLLSQS